jgi:hypothetical protein
MELKNTIVLLFLIKGAVSLYPAQTWEQLQTLLHSSKMLVDLLTVALLALNSAQRCGEGIRKCMLLP